MPGSFHWRERPGAIYIVSMTSSESTSPFRREETAISKPLKRFHRAQIVQIALLLGLWAALSAWIVRLPHVLVEPDDEMYFLAMRLFAGGEVLWSSEALERETAAMQEAHSRITGQAQGAFRMDRQMRAPSFFRPAATDATRFTIEKSPGHPILLAAAFNAGVEDWLQSGLALLAALFVYGIARRLGDPRGWIAFAAATLMLLNANCIAGQWRLYMSDYSSAIMVTLGMGLYLWARDAGRLWMFAASGLALAVSVAFRYTNALAIAGIVLYEIVRAFETGWRPAFARFLKHKGHWVAAVAALVGAVPLCWYLFKTTGNPFETGYAQRFDRQYTAYFSLFDREALFSLANLPAVFFTGFPQFVLGFPLLPLSIAGLAAAPRRASRPALFLGLWILPYWALHLCYGWTRVDSFVFMCRKFLPTIAPLCLLAAYALGWLSQCRPGGIEHPQAVARPRERRIPIAAAIGAWAALVALGLSLGCAFCIRYGEYGTGLIVRDGRGAWKHKTGAPAFEAGGPRGPGQGGGLMPGMQPRLNQGFAPQGARGGMPGMPPNQNQGFVPPGGRGQGFRPQGAKAPLGLGPQNQRFDPQPTIPPQP